MSEGYTVEDTFGDTIGIVVRKEAGHGFRFFSATRTFDALDGRIFANPQAAQRAAFDIGRRDRSRLTNLPRKEVAA